MSKQKNKFKEAAKQAAKTNDHNEGGDFEFKLPPEGNSWARLVEWIETGVQPQKEHPKYGKKDPAAMVTVTFELLSSKYINERDGKEVADRITIYNIPIKKSSKAKFMKLMKALKYGREDINHGGMCIGDAYKVKIVHNEGTTTDDKGKPKVYANITDADGNFLIYPAIVVKENEDGEVVSQRPAEVREEISDLRMFVWDNPNMEQWDSIFIDGEYEITNAKGKKEMVSKNRYQNAITSALNFEGSPIQALLEGSDELPDSVEDMNDEDELDEEVEEVEDEMEEEDSDDLSDDELDDEPPVKKVTKAAKKEKPVKRSGVQGMKELGLDDDEDEVVVKVKKSVKGKARASSVQQSRASVTKSRSKGK